MTRGVFWCFCQLGKLLLLSHRFCILTTVRLGSQEAIGQKRIGLRFTHTDAFFQQGDGSSTVTVLPRGKTTISMTNAHAAAHTGPKRNFLSENSEILRCRDTLKHWARLWDSETLRYWDSTLILWIFWQKVMVYLSVQHKLSDGLLVPPSGVGEKEHHRSGQKIFFLGLKMKKILGHTGNISWRRVIAWKNAWIY